MFLQLNVTNLESDLEREALANNVNAIPPRKFLVTGKSVHDRYNLLTKQIQD